jgi:Tol biopolymer transport system component
MTTRKTLELILISVLCMLFTFTLTRPSAISAQQPKPSPTPKPTGHIVYRDGTKLFSIADNGTGQKVIGDNKKYVYLCASWSRDGKSLAVVGGGASGFELYTLNSTGSGQKAVVSAGTGDMPGLSPAWSPDAKQIAYISQNSKKLYIVSVDGKSTTSSETIEALNVDWSPDGATLVVFGKDARGKTGLFLLDSSGQNPKLILELPTSDWEQSFDAEHYFTRDIVWPHWSPDGQKIVFASTINGNLEISTVDSAGGNFTQITKNDVPDYAPSWVADGKSIVFISERDGDKGIYLWDTTNSTVSETKERRVTVFREGGCPSWQLGSK